MKRSIVKAKHLSNSFWVEVVTCSIFLLERSPTRNVQNVTLIEAWSGFKLSVKHLKVFTLLLMLTFQSVETREKN